VPTSPRELASYLQKLESVCEDGFSLFLEQRVEDAAHVRPERVVELLLIVRIGLYGCCREGQQNGGAVIHFERVGEPPRARRPDVGNGSKGSGCFST